ncbi:hypothetical protein K1719_046147 [Acacia pycnantha]|nr:hypothetical protein K1719_046147 [Acacia pycnantha]
MYLANLSETRLDTKESAHLKDPYVLGEHLGWGQQDPPHLQLNCHILDLQLTSSPDKVCMGVILYILLSGMPPFWGKTKSRIFEAVKAADCASRLRLSIPSIAAVLYCACCLQRQCLFY